MKITRKSPVSGVTNTLDLPITQEQIRQFELGKSVKFAFSNLTPCQAEFYLTGITEDEWNKIFENEGD